MTHPTPDPQPSLSEEGELEKLLDAFGDAHYSLTLTEDLPTGEVSRFDVSFQRARLAAARAAIVEYLADRTLSAEEAKTILGGLIGSRLHTSIAGVPNPIFIKLRRISGSPFKEAQ